MEELKSMINDLCEKNESYEEGNKNLSEELKKKNYKIKNLSRVITRKSNEIKGLKYTLTQNEDFIRSANSCNSNLNKVLINSRILI